jgi:hypothetical protein
MVNRQTPDYLSNLIPETIAMSTSYNLRNQNQLKNINCKTTSYARSFYPQQSGFGTRYLMSIEAQRQSVNLRIILEMKMKIKFCLI